MQETLSQYSAKELARWRVLSIAFAMLAFSIGAAAFLGWILGGWFSAGFATAVFVLAILLLLAGQHVPVVAITGFGRTDDIERARTAGFYSHLTKPLNLDALAEVLNQLARHQRGRGANGPDHTPDTDFDATGGPVC